MITAMMLRNAMLRNAMLHFALLLPRRMVARFVGQVEGILRQAAIPREVEALESGGYWDGPEALGQTLQRSASSLFAPAKTLDQMLAKDDDCSAQFVFFLRHPMRQFVSTLLPVLFSFVTRYKLIWTNAEVSTQYNSLRDDVYCRALCFRCVPRLCTSSFYLV